MKYKFSEELLALFRDFYTMTGGVEISVFETPVHVSQFDMTLNFHNCLVYPSIDMGDVFCKAIRRSRAVDAQCLACDKANTECCQSSGKVSIYRCHLGFLEGQIPIDADNETAALLFIGQVSDSPLTGEHFDKLWFRLRRLDPEFFTDDKRETYYNYYTRIKVMTEEQFSAYCSFLYTISRDWYANGFVMRCSESQSDAIRSYILQHLHEPIQAEPLCETLHISRATLYRILKSETGMGLNTYVNRCKIERACQLLIRNYSVKEIANMLGYDNVNYFSRVFREFSGLTPTEYKKEYTHFLSSAKMRQ
ncbi:MAG: helix-turn-helix domain-containing protein [Clostridia bacterium]|nr:helix-turn-helix domain-containing protein [Clostridia bacterium]